MGIYDILPPIDSKDYKGPDRRYGQHTFVGIDNRDLENGFTINTAYKKKPVISPGIIIDLKI